MKKIEREYCDKIKESLDTNQEAVEKAILLIYQRQTPDERSCKETLEVNGRGFSGAHAEFMSSLAESILRGWHLSKNQLPHGRNIIKKYSRQLLEEAKLAGKFQQFVERKSQEAT